MLKLIVVDDHRMFRESISKMLISEGIANVIAEANNGKEFLLVLEKQLPDIVLMDISMPIMDGIEATQIALKKYHDLNILALSMFGDENYYYSMVEAGAKGFVLKSASLTELENAITEISKGGSWFSADLLQRLIIKINAKTKQQNTLEFSDREAEIIKLICEGLTNEQIASKINLSYDTIKWHRANINSKTGCNNTASLVMYAIKNNLVTI